MEIQYSEPLRVAWTRARSILFQPFDLGKWMVLAFTAWLAYLFHSGGFRYTRRGSLGHADPGDMAREMGRSLGHLRDNLLLQPGTLLLVALGMLFALLLLLVLLWVSSRMKLVFLDNVVRDRAEVVEPWRRLGSLGDSLFLWRLGFGLVAALVFGGLVAALTGLVVLLTAGTSVTAVIGVLGTVLSGATILAAVAVTLLVALWTENFVVPIMYRFNLGVLEAWKAFLPWLQAYLGSFVVYVLFLLAVAVGLGVVILVAGLLTCCIGLIVLALPYLGTLLLLPVWVTYRLVGPVFLAQFAPEFDLFVPTPVPADETLPGETEGA